MIGLATLLLVLAPEQSGANAPLKVNVHDCKHNYAIVERSLEIATRASSPSDPKLDSMVAPNAEFELWNGDASWLPREEKGAAAARAFFKQVGSTNYVVHKGLAPVCVVDANSAVIEFISPDGERSIFVTFVFGGSQLLRATGETDVREHGKLGVEAERG